MGPYPISSVQALAEFFHSQMNMVFRKRAAFPNDSSELHRRNRSGNAARTDGGGTCFFHDRKIGVRCLLCPPPPLGQVRMKLEMEKVEQLVLFQEHFSINQRKKAINNAK